MVPEAIVIGGSAGALEALSEILPGLPAGFPAVVLVVVHVPADVPTLLPVIFASRCRLRVMEALDKQPVGPGDLVFAPSDHHLLVERDRTLALSRDAPVLRSRPAIDVLFTSAADAYGARLVGVLLSGMSRDGVAGLRAIRGAGGRTIVQDPASATSPDMPRAALAESLADDVLSPFQIGRALRALAEEASPA